MAGVKLYELPNGTYLEVPGDATDEEVLQFANKAAPTSSPDVAMQPSHASTDPYTVTPATIATPATKLRFDATSVGPAPERPMWSDDERNIVQQAIPFVPWGLMPDADSKVLQSMRQSVGGGVTAAGDALNYAVNAAPQGFRDLAAKLAATVYGNAPVPGVGGMFAPDMSQFMKAMPSFDANTKPGHATFMDLVSAAAADLRKEGQALTKANVRRQSIEEPYESHKTIINDPEHALLTAIEGAGPSLVAGVPALMAAYLTGVTTLPAAIASGLMSRGIESAMEGGEALGEQKDIGKSDEEAAMVANRRFAGNMGLVGADVAEMATLLLPLPTPVKKVITAVAGRVPGHMTIVAAKALANAWLEGKEEGLQAEIAKWAKGEDWTLDPREFDPQAVKAGELNALMMGGPVAAVTEPKVAIEKSRNREFKKLLAEAQQQLKPTDEAAAKVLQTMRTAKTVKPTENQIATARFEEAPEWMEPNSELRAQWAQGKVENEDVASRPELEVAADKALIDLQAAEAKVVERLGPLADGTPPAPPPGFEPGVKNEATRAVEVIKTQLLDAAALAETAGDSAKAQSLRYHASEIYPSNPQDDFHVALAEFGATRGMHTVYFRAADGAPIGGQISTPGVVAIRENLSNPEAAVASMFHEMQHQFEAKDPEAWAAMVDQVKTAFPQEWEQAEKSIPRRYYRAAGVELTKQALQSEVIAEFFEKRSAGVLQAIGQGGLVESAAKKPGALSRALEWIGEWMRSFAAWTGKKLAGKSETSTLGKIGRKSQLWGMADTPAIKRDAAQLALDMAKSLETLKGPMRADVDIASWRPTTQQPQAPITPDPAANPPQSPPAIPTTAPPSEPAAAALPANERRAELRPDAIDRRDALSRKRVDEMTDEEKVRALLRDELTGLGNKRAHTEALAEKVVEGTRLHAMLDLDDFKTTNDTHGHEVGDDVLAAVGRIIAEETENAEGIRAMRFGGDEFVLVADGLEAAAFETVMKTIQERISETKIALEYSDGETDTVGIGASYGTGDSFKTADEALYENKEARKASGARVGIRQETGRDASGLAPEAAEGYESHRDSAAAETDELDEPPSPEPSNEKRVLSEDEVPSNPGYDALPRWLAQRPWLAEPWMHDKLTDAQVIDELSEGKRVTAMRRKRGLRQLADARAELNEIVEGEEWFRNEEIVNLRRDPSVIKRVRKNAFRALYLKETVQEKGKYHRAVAEDFASIASVFRTNNPNGKSLDEFLDEEIRNGNVPPETTESDIVEMLSGPAPAFHVNAPVKGRRQASRFIENEESRIRRLIKRVDRAYKTGDLDLAERLDVRLEAKLAALEGALEELEEGSGLDREFDEAEEVHTGKGVYVGADEANMSERSESDLDEMLAATHAQIKQGRVQKEDAVYTIRENLWRAAVAQFEDRAVIDKMREIPDKTVLGLAEAAYNDRAALRTKLTGRPAFQVVEDTPAWTNKGVWTTGAINPVDKGRYILIELTERDAESLEKGVGIPRGWILTWPHKRLIDRDLFNRGIPSSAMKAAEKAMLKPRTALVRRTSPDDDLKKYPGPTDVRYWIMVGRAQLEMRYPEQRKRKNGPGYEEVPGTGWQPPKMAIPQFQVSDVATELPGMFSTLERTVEASPDQKWQPRHFLGWLKKQPGIKTEEYEWSGVEHFVDLIDERDGKLTRDQVLGYLKNNGVKVKEILHGERPSTRGFVDRFAETGTGRFGEIYQEGDLYYFADGTERVGGFLSPAGAQEIRLERMNARRDPFGDIFSVGEEWFYAVGENDEGPYNSSQEAQEHLLKALDQWKLDNGLPIGYAFQSFSSGEWYYEIFGRKEGPFQTEMEAQQSLDEDYREAQEVNDRRLNRTGVERRSVQPEIPTKYDNYTLPGGKNYRELLFILERPKMSQTDIDRHIELESRLDDLTAEEYDEYYLLDEEVDKEFGSNASYHTGHWDPKNVLAHVRFNERKGEFGEKILFLEEIQSDWHQEGRKKNYGIREYWALEGKEGRVIGEYLSEGMARESLERIKDAYSDRDKGWYGPAEELKVVKTGRTRKSDFPDAPFKGNAWVNLALKRMVRWAVENDFDTVAWTTGEQQAYRYDLSKEIDEIHYNPETQVFIANKGARGTPQHRRMIKEEMVTEDKLVDFIGKELAQKLLAQEPNVNGLLTLRGVELKIGGEGMKTFYDKTLRNLAQKLYKKYGVKVGPVTTMFEAPPIGLVEQPYGDGHGFRITKKLRNGVMEGQPLFQVRAMANEPGAPQFRDGAPGWTLPPENWLDARRRLLQDKFLRVKRLQEQIEETTQLELSDKLNVYLLEEQYYGKVRHRIEKMQTELIDPLIRRMRKLGVSPETLELYIYARHAPERNYHLYDIHYDRPIANVNRETGEIERNKSYSEGYKKQLLAKQRATLDELFKMHDEKRIPNSGMTDDESAAIIQKFKEQGLLSGTEKVRIIGNQKRASNLLTYVHTGKLAVLAEMFDKIVLRKLEILSHEGLETEQAIHNVVAQYDYYAPLKGRDLEGDLEELLGPVEASAGKGFDIRGLELEHSLGRKKRAKNPILAQAVLDLEETIIRAEKNAVGESFLSLVEAHPNPDLWEVNKVVKKYVYDPQLKQAVSVIDKFRNMKPWVLAVKREGVEHYIHMKDARLASAMKNLGAESSGKFIQLLGKGTRWLAAVNTSMNPEFVLANFTRDIQTAAINLSAEGTEAMVKQIGRDVLPAIVGIEAALYGKEANKYSKIFEDYKKAGAAIGFFGLESIEDRAQTVAKQWRRAGTDIKARGWNAAAAVGGLIGNINEAVENGVRLAAFHNAREAGLSELKAASLARNLTVNFNRKGEVGQTVNALYMFANAGVQGSARLLAAARHSPRVRRLLAGIVAASYGLATYNRAIGGQDDDGEWMWDKVPQYVKDRNIVVMLPGGEKWITFPAPYGYNVMLTTGNTLEALHASFRGIGRKKSAVEAALDIGDSAIGGFNPLGDARLTSWHGFGTATLPTLVDPLLDLTANRTFYGAPIHPEQPQFGTPKPRSELAWKSVSRASDKLAKNLNRWAGGNESQPGEVFGHDVSISPETIDYIASVLFGGAGQTAMNTGGSIIDAASGRSRRIGKIPFIRRFMGEQTEYHVPGVFRDTINRLDQAEAALKTIQEERPREEDGWMERYGDLVPLFEFKKAIEKEIRAAAKDGDDKRVLELKKEMNREFRLVTEGR